MINLKKGGNINLSKEAPNATKFIFGLGWDKNRYDGAEFDADASAALLNAAGKINGDGAFVFFNNKVDDSGSVELSGDNRTGEGEGHDETITVDLGAIPSTVETVRFAVTIYEAEERKQNFGQVENAYIEVIDAATNAVVTRYDLSEDFSVETCVVIGELYKKNNEWKFKAVGAGYGGGLQAYVEGLN